MLQNLDNGHYTETALTTLNKLAHEGGYNTEPFIETILPAEPNDSQAYSPTQLRFIDIMIDGGFYHTEDGLQTSLANFNKLDSQAADNLVTLFQNHNTNPQKLQNLITLINDDDQTISNDELNSFLNKETTYQAIDMIINKKWKLSLPTLKQCISDPELGQAYLDSMANCEDGKTNKQIYLMLQTLSDSNNQSIRKAMQYMFNMNSSDLANENIQQLNTALDTLKNNKKLTKKLATPCQNACHKIYQALSQKLQNEIYRSQGQCSNPLLQYTVFKSRTSKKYDYKQALHEAIKLYTNQKSENDKNSSISPKLSEFLQTDSEMAQAAKTLLEVKGIKLGHNPTDPTQTDAASPTQNP